MDRLQVSGPPRTARDLLVDRVYGRFFWTKVLSLTGIWAQNIAAAIVMWELTGSATLVGAISIAQFVPTLVLAPFTGALSDIMDRRRLLMLGRTVSGGAAAVLVILPATGRPLSSTMLIAVTGVVGLGISLSSPALQALIPALIPARDLDQAIALNAIVGNIARAVGPAVGAGLMAAGGASLAFAFGSFGHLVFAAALIGLTGPTPKAGVAGRRILDGIRYLRDDRGMGYLLLGTAALSFGVDPILTLTPALADSVGAGSGAVGAMASSFGTAAVIAATLLGTLRRRFALQQLALFGFGLLTGGLLVVAASPALMVALVGFAAAGVGFLIATTALTTEIQRRVPEHLRGRIMALWTVAFLGFRPVAAAVNGALTDVTDVRVAVVVGSLITAASMFTSRVGAADGDPVDGRGSVDTVNQ